MTEKLHNKKIVLINLLKSKGIYNPDLFAKILNSNKRQLNLIHAKNIKGLHINVKQFLKHIIKDNYFRNKINLDDKITIITIEIDKILKSRYYNNKSNVIFQDLIHYILDLLSDRKVNFGNTHLGIDLHRYIKYTYYIESKINVINEIRKAGKYTLSKVKLVSELIDHVDYLNFLNNDITKIQRLRMKSVSSYNIDAYIVKFKDAIKSFVNSDKLLKEIYEELTTNRDRIQTKLLYNKLVQLKEELRQRMHEITYGIEYKSKLDHIESMGNIYYKGYLPFAESGGLEISDKQFRNLHINTMYFKSSNKESIKDFKNGYYNKHKIVGQINVIAEGINQYNKGKYNKSYFIQYQYITTQSQTKQFNTIMQNLKKSLINDKQYNKTNDFKDYITCVYSYPFINQKENYKAFKQYYKEINKSRFNLKYRNLYPYINKTSAQKNRFLSFTSYNNNIWREYLIRKGINRNIANIIYILDLERIITDFYNPKNQLQYTKRKQRLFIAKIIKAISMDRNLTNLFNDYLYELSQDYDKRIYLFQTYGIDALKNQILNLQNFYNTNFKYKWDNDAKNIKVVIRSFKRQLKQRKIYLDFIMMQQFTVNKFKNNYKAYNVLIQSILHQNIKKYLTKTLIRRITTQRSKVECIMMACNNLNSIEVKYTDLCPIYVKEIKDDFTKFDELLGTSEITKVQYIDKEKSIDIIALFKCIAKFDKFLNLDDLYNYILNLKIDGINDLKSFVFKEKSILNQF